jgi:hypothetical protein
MWMCSPPCEFSNEAGAPHVGWDRDVVSCTASQVGVSSGIYQEDREWRSIC